MARAGPTSCIASFSTPAVAEQMATLPDEALVGYAEVLLLVGSRLAGF
jgi:hypothetical protein